MSTRDRIADTIAGMQVALQALDGGLITEREARDFCVDDAQQMLSEAAEQELGRAEAAAQLAESGLKAPTTEPLPPEDLFVGQVELTGLERSYLQKAIVELYMDGTFVGTSEDRMRFAQRVAKKTLGALRLRQKPESKG